MASTMKSDSKNQYNRTVGGMGRTELIIGILMVIFGVFTVASHETATNHYNHLLKSKVSLVDKYPVRSELTYTSQGIICGLAMIASGVFGILLKQNPSGNLYIANMVIAIVSAMAALLTTVLSIFAVNEAFFSEALIVSHAFIGLLGAVAIAVTLTHAVFCYYGMRHQASPSNSQVTVETSHGLLRTAGTHV